MTTNQREACLTGESMGRLAQDEFLPVELAQVEEHIGSCERCRNMLESASLDSEWNDEVLPVLRTPSEGNRPCGDPNEGGHDEQSLESLLKLLGPTDDPHKLGRIGTYEVIGIIGRGGMGVVFKAFDAALNRFVAIKMLLPHMAVSGAARKRFAREGQAAAAVIDDNVLPIYSVAEWQGVPYLVTQFSRGITLQKRIQDQGPLELKEILRIGMQTARGLAAAHAQGLVHRDVKPSNILLDGTVERALLTDFGLARAVDDASITRTGTIAGTPQYMSPEQARGQSVDARSDLFSLGSVLYAMCTGRPPFRADSSYAVLRLIADDEPWPIREINPEIPEWLCSIVTKLMSKRASDRFESAAEVAELLEKCLAHVQHPVAVPLPTSLASHITRGRWFFHSSRKGLLVLLGMIGMSLLGMVLLQATEAPDIAGQWTGEEWGQVVLEPKKTGGYDGTYTDTFGKVKGKLQLKWSRTERRFNGTWQEGKDRFGRISVRLVDDEIRGAWTTNPQSNIHPGAPGLADLVWSRDRPNQSAQKDKERRAMTPQETPSPETKKPGERVSVLAPQQIVENGEKLYHSRERIAVQFKVTSTSPIVVIDEKGTQHEQYDLSAEDVPAFSVRLTDKAVNWLKINDVADVRKHFVGKWIKVEGTVYGVGLDLISRPETQWTYHLDLNSLDQLSEVEPAALVARNAGLKNDPFADPSVKRETLPDSTYKKGSLPPATVAGAKMGDAANAKSTRLLDVLKQDMERERARFPLLDRVIEDIRLMEGGGLEILEKPVREDREQYAKDHPDLAKAFEGWQNDYRYVLRSTEAIPELFEDEETRHVMVTVAKLLIQSEAIRETSKERLAEARKQLGDDPADELVTKLFLGLLSDGLPELRRRLRESGENVPHTGTHEDHLRVSESLRTHHVFARLYCGIDQSEMFRQIRKSQESADPDTAFLFADTHPLSKDKKLSFLSRRGHEEVVHGQLAYHALPKDSVIVKWKAGDQEARLTNPDSLVITHVIIDRKTDGKVVWNCYGIPKDNSPLVPATWFRPDPFPQLANHGATKNCLCRMEMELASYEPAQRELAVTPEQQQQIRNINVAAIPFNANGGLTQQSTDADDRIIQILRPEQRSRLQQLLLQRLGLAAFDVNTIREALEISAEQQTQIQESWRGHAKRVQDYDVALNDQNIAASQAGKSDPTQLQASVAERQQQKVASEARVWNEVYMILDATQRQQFETLRGAQVTTTEIERVDAPNTPIDSAEDPGMGVPTGNATPGK